MKPPLTGLLLLSLCSISSRSVSLVTHVMTQSPDDSVMEGDTVNISCCVIKDTLDISKARISWLKNDTSINKSITITLGNQSVNSDSNNCFTLPLSNITKKDSGRYVCRLTVEIPVYRVIDGNGTVITVRGTKITKDVTRDDTFDVVSEDAQEDVLTHIMRCLPALALFITFIYLYCSWSKAQSHTPAGPGNKPTSDEQESEESASENERKEEHTLSDN